MTGQTIQLKQTGDVDVTLEAHQIDARTWVDDAELLQAIHTVTQCAYRWPKFSLTVTHGHEVQEFEE